MEQVEKCNYVLLVEVYLHFPTCGECLAKIDIELHALCHIRSINMQVSF